MDEGVPAFWKPGDVILDLYEVKGVHTEGGMGLVYRVYNRQWAMDVAVKCPREEYFAGERQRETFVREAETWVSLGAHPHVVSCYYVRTLGGIPRIFAEYVDGGTLRTWVTSRTLYRTDEGSACEAGEAAARILDVAIQAAWGLHFAHERGLVHQDMKPANVMMRRDASGGSGRAGQALVTDFGLARARGAAGEGARAAPRKRRGLSSWGGMTLEYCSPEQAANERLTRRSDVWSWGVSVLEMFRGDVTWTSGAEAAKALEECAAAGPVDPAIPRMPGAVRDLLRRCFAREPGARPGTMLEAAQALEEAHRRLTGLAYCRRRPAAQEVQADSLNNRAVSFIDFGRPEDAERTLEEALALDPAHPQATYNLGLLRWRWGRSTGEAVAGLLERMERAGGAWEVSYLLGCVRMELGDQARAFEALTRAARRADALFNVEVARAFEMKAGGRAPYAVRRPGSGGERAAVRTAPPTAGGDPERRSGCAGVAAAILAALAAAAWLGS